MDQQTLELLRALQSSERDGKAFAHIRALLSQERTRLAGADDRATLADISELLEMWADSASPELAAAAAAEAGQIADEDLEQAERAVQLYQLSLERAPKELEALRKLDALFSRRGQHERLEAALSAHAERLQAVSDAQPAAVAGVYRRLAQLRAERGSELGPAIEAYERALDLAVDADIIRELADLYGKRRGQGDDAHAADLYCMLAEVLGAGDGLPMLERALDLAPGHDAALDLLESYVPAADQTSKLQGRWAAYIERSDNAQGVDRRRALLARIHTARGQHREALICLGPLIEKGDADALKLQVAVLAALQEQEQRDSAPPAALSSGNGAIVRPPTLVGFRVPAPDEPQVGDDEASASDPHRRPRVVKADLDHEVNAVRATESDPNVEASENNAAAVQASEVKPVRGKEVKPVSIRPARSGETLVGFRLPEALSGLDARGPAAAKALEPAASGPRAKAARGDKGTKSDAKAKNARVAVTDGGLSRVPAASAKAVAPESSGAAAATLTARPKSAAQGSPARARSAVAQSAQPPVAGVTGAAAKAAALRASRAPAVAPGAAVSAAAVAPPTAVPRASAPRISGSVAQAPRISSPPVLVRPPPAALVTAPPVLALAPAEPEPLLQAVVVAAPHVDALFDADEALPSLPSSGGDKRWLIVGAVTVAAVVALGALALGSGSKQAPPVASTRGEAVAPQAAPLPVPEPPVPAASPPVTPPVVVAAAVPVAVAPAPSAAQEQASRPKKSSSKASPVGRLVPGKAHVVGGGLSAQQIALVLEDTLPSIERCYAEALGDKPRLQGRVVFGWTIEKNGHPSHVHALSGTLKDNAVQQCSLEALRKARFPKPKKKASEIAWPLDYKKS